MYLLPMSALSLRLFYPSSCPLICIAYLGTVDTLLFLDSLVLEEIFGERLTIRYESLTILHFHSIL